MVNIRLFDNALYVRVAILRINLPGLWLHIHYVSRKVERGKSSRCIVLRLSLRRMLQSHTRGRLGVGKVKAVPVTTPLNVRSCTRLFRTHLRNRFSRPADLVLHCHTTAGCRSGQPSNLLWPVVICRRCCKERICLTRKDGRAKDVHVPEEADLKKESTGRGACHD
jgi:hypothetical protein